MLIADGPALLPETRDDAEYVDCKQCRNLLPDNALGQANGVTTINEGDGACSVSPAPEG